MLQAWLIILPANAKGILLSHVMAVCAANVFRRRWTQFIRSLRICDVKIPIAFAECMNQPLDTIGNCQRLVGVSQHVHKITSLWKFELNRSSKLRDNNEKEKNTIVASWSQEVVCFQMLDFKTSNSKTKVSKSKLWKITSFSKTKSLQRELFLTMFYTTNLSPLLVTK